MEVVEAEEWRIPGKESNWASVEDSLGSKACCSAPAVGEMGSKAGSRASCLVPEECGLGSQECCWASLECSGGTPGYRQGTEGCC